jgi:hypothetical protein
MAHTSAVIESVCRETAAWCSFADTRDQLRTPALRPTLPECPLPGDLERAVQTLAMSRRALLSGRSIADPRGRLLVCEVNESICSGESEAVTQGFFDVDDRPAWDTWVASVPRPSERSNATLISWVPWELVPLVQRGIEVNPYECILWLSDDQKLLAEWPVARALVTAGLG